MLPELHTPSAAKKGALVNTTLKAELLAAVRVALAGDWQAAHVVAQAHDDEPLANWLHAVVHRMEGDVGNARYWFQRSGHSLRPEVPTEAELAEIESALLA